MGPPAEAVLVGQPSLSPVSMESNGPQLGWSGELQKGALEMHLGPSLPLLPAGADNEILQLIAGYLEARGLTFKVEKKSAGKDASVQQRLGGLILDGKWEEALQALEAVQVTDLLHEQCGRGIHCSNSLC